MKFMQLLVPCTALLAIVGCNNAPQNTSAQTSPSSTAAGNAKMTIAVIPKGTTHVFWKAVEAGARQAGQESGADIQWKGPLKESDRASQIQIVQQFVSDGVSAIVLAPLDDKALVRPVQSAMAKKIPVVIIDSALKGQVGKDFTSFVATDNYQGGVLAGERMAKLLNGKGKVVMLRYQEGSDSTNNREEGFLSVMKKNPGIAMISDNRYGGATAGESKDASMQMVDKLRAADGIYCPNESSTLGMLLALRQNGLAGQKKFVGFDSSPQLLEGLNKGQIDALVVQNPKKIGYEGVKTAVAAIKGEKVPDKVDTGIAVVDKANVDSAAMKELLGT